MAFILSNQRAENCSAAFERYRDYVNKFKDKFPKSVYELATSDWYFDGNEPRCPHDAHLESFSMSEQEQGDETCVSMAIKLKAVYQNGLIEFYYPRVFKYQLATLDVESGHRDWRYDEFSISENGNVLHEIEWWSSHETGRWLIEASEVLYKWIPS